MNKGIYQETLNEWVKTHSSEDLRLLFYYFDGTMQHIHNNGWAIDDFSLDEIFVHDKAIRFHKLVQLSKDASLRNDMIHDNIFKSALLKIAICFGKETPDISLDQIVSTLSSNGGSVLKSNFDSYINYLPEPDLDYYRRIIQDGDNVYYHEYFYDVEKNKASISNESGNKNTNTKQLVKSSNYNIGVAPVTSDIDVSMYSKIDKDGAFINYFIIPVLLFVLGFVITFIIWVLNI